MARLGKRERLSKRQGFEWLARCRERADAEVPQVFGSGPQPLRANGSGPLYRWPIASKCSLNATHNSLVRRRKAGLRDKLANLKYNGVRRIKES